MTTQPTALYLADVIDNDAKSAAHHKAAAAELRRLHAEVEALKADAERYRWLRDAPWPSELADIIRLQLNAKWDAAIDAVRGKK